MNYSILSESEVPAYIQLYRFLVRDIVSGVYPFGARLPSKRTIASETGVSLITVEHALALLTEEGYIETRMRSGCFVLYKSADFQGIPDTEAARPAERTSLSRPEDVFPFTVLARTTRRVLSDYGERLLARSPNFGMPELKTEICRYLYRSRGIRVLPEQVIVGSGAEYLYGLAAQFLGTDKRFALEEPSYDKIRKVYEALGIACEALPLTEEGISAAALSACEADVLHVTPFNSFPSGVTAGISKKHAYIRWAKKHGSVLIEDNYDSELTVSRKAEEPLFSMADGARVIYINSFSQTIAPAIRVGYMLLPREMTEPFREKLGFYSCTVPVLDQMVIAELLKSGDFERHINRVRRKKRSRQKEEVYK